MVYHRDRLGRIIQKDSHWADNTHSESKRRVGNSLPTRFNNIN
ncbi:hypothetical protein [Wielerella bovis]|nr:hypothetical protein [Wielerella bovis]